MVKWDEKSIAHVYQGMRDHSLPYAEWSHQAHISTGLAFLDEFGLEQAEILMPKAIWTYNASLGNENSDTEGYHHTITLLYLRVLDTLRNKCGSTDLQSLVRAALQSEIADKSWPLTHYSKELLFSVKARKNWVEPDLKPLPTS
ncbi:MAG: hypothetical protein COA47_07680 [Robiginitomaculum sp.]|nr:MAG: hypothetical protein COA47_07680 [Robiginitomaculum sp.]